MKPETYPPGSDAAEPSIPPPPRAAKPERDEMRRAEIVAAARACVLRHGFHAASMAEIAREARMSVGQIYRYFDNKEAVVHAIVEDIVSVRLAWIAGTARQIDLARVLAERMFDGESDADHTLLLEVTAEATRNPAVADIVRRADRRLQAQAVAAVLQDQPRLSAAEAAARVEFMAVLSEGTALRRVTEQQADPALLAALYREVIAQVLPGAPAAPPEAGAHGTAK